MKPADVTEADMAKAQDWYWALYNSEDNNPTQDADKAVIELAADFAVHRIAAYEAGRVAGLEEAADIADQHIALGYMSGRERSYCHEHGDEIASAIRALKEKNDG